jgi:regulation of enolase protein 1 (concanavalin A-like superfamily)
MYTSPAGNGHYVLKSNSPTGPFVAVTDNFGLSIDGDVFIDDDGSWYFYSAAYDGIMAYTMSSPDKVDVDSGIKIPCDMHGWTEGSMIVKHDGIYYMTYTGNHVWSAGYRINYAISCESPLAFEQVDNNPLLLSTDPVTVKGIGHSSTVLGPNLDEYYIVYHSFTTVPLRNMNIDRIAFNGSETVVLGATTYKQQAPAMPDLYSRFESEDELQLWKIKNGGFDSGEFVLQHAGTILSKQDFTGDYTAEINLKAISDKAGVLIDYQDDMNYTKAVYDADSYSLTVSFVVNGKETSKVIPIKASFADKLNADALILFTVRKSEDQYTFFVNNREVLSANSKLSGGAFGVICESGKASVGFVGITNGALQSTLSDVYKPIDNVIPAFSCKIENRKIKSYDNVKYLVAESGCAYEYKVNVKTIGFYDMIVEYRSNEDCVIDVYLNGERIGEITLGDSGENLLRIAGRKFYLDSGLGTVTLRVREGNARLLDFSFHKSVAVSKQTWNFESFKDVYYKDGSWKNEGGSLVLNGEFGKYMVGSENWGNYTVESDITVTSQTINAGLCVRVSNPSTHSENNISKGSDYLQGYFIGLGDNSVFLGKHNYDWKMLKQMPFAVQSGQTYHLKVDVEENVIRISVDGTLLITYEDTDAPFLHGMVGYRAHACSMKADNLTVSPIS